MLSSKLAYSAKLHAVLFMICAACTVWLLVQNTILFAFMPWHGLPAVLEAPAPLLRAMVVGVVQLSLVTIAFALGWLISRRSTLASKSGERA